MAFETNGVHEWDGKEIDEKIALMTAAPKSVVSIVRTHINDDEYQVVDLDLENFGRELGYHRAAQNAIYNWLELPEGLEKYIDAVIAMALDEGSRKFSATNLELAQQLFIGKRGSKDYAKKWITDKKKKLQNWQSFNNVLLIDVEDGAFDPVKRKNHPTNYRIYIVDMILETVVEAKDSDDWKKARNRYHKNKAIRRAARKIALKAKESPLIRPAKDRSLSEEEKFDRRHRLILSSMVRNREFLNKMNMTYEDYFLFLVSEMDKIATNPAGANRLLTPEKDEANHHISVFSKIKSGEIVEEIEKNNEHLDKKISLLDALKGDRVEYGAIAVAEEEREVKSPKVWQDGHFVELSNNIETKTEDFAPHDVSDLSEGHFSSQSEKSVCKPLEIKDRRRDILNSENNEIIGEKTSVVEGTFPEVSAEIEPDFSDWFNEAAEIEPAKKYDLEDLRQIVANWCAIVAKKLPDAKPSELQKGVWQVYWGEQFDHKSILLQADMAMMPRLIAEGQKPISALKPMFVEWIMSRVTYFQHDVPQRGAYDSRYKEFRQKLLNSQEIKLPEGYDDG